MSRRAVTCLTSICNVKVATPNPTGSPGLTTCESPGGIMGLWDVPNFVAVDFVRYPRFDFYFVAAARKREQIPSVVSCRQDIKKRNGRARIVRPRLSRSCRGKSSVRLCRAAKNTTRNGGHEISRSAAEWDTSHKALNRCYEPCTMRSIQAKTLRAMTA